MFFSKMYTEVNPAGIRILVAGVGETTWTAMQLAE